MPDTLPLLVGAVAGVVGALVASLPWVRLDPLEVTMVVFAIVATMSEVGSPRLAVAIVLVLVAWRLPAVPVIAAGCVVVAAELVGVDSASSADIRLGVAGAVAALVLAALMVFGGRAFGPAPTVLVAAWVPWAMYLAVPDTEEVTAIGAALAIIGLALVAQRVQPAPAGLAAVGMALAWAAMRGARGREESFVAIACAMGLVLAPLFVVFGRRLRWRSFAGLIFAAAHVAGGIVLARNAGLGTDLSQALRRAALVLGAMVAVGLVALLLSPLAQPQHE